jgi:hypothetical protein
MRLVSLPVSDTSLDFGKSDQPLPKASETSGTMQSRFFAEASAAGTCKFMQAHSEQNVIQQ